MKFITIGYGDQAGYDRTQETLRNAAHTHDAWLVECGSVLGVAGTPTQVRNHEGKGVQSEPGAFMHAALPVAGFGVIEAENVDAAVELVSKTPCAIAYGVVEVWPLVTQ